MPFPMIDVRATGQNISHLLKQRQISIRTLQAYFGFDSPRAIYKWLRGENLPTVDNLFALSKLLRIPLQDILIEQANDGQDVPFIQPWRFFDLIQRNLSGGSRFFAAFGQRPFIIRLRTAMNDAPYCAAPGTRPTRVLSTLLSRSAGIGLAPASQR